MSTLAHRNSKFKNLLSVISVKFVINEIMAVKKNLWEVLRANRGLTWV